MVWAAAAFLVALAVLSMIVSLVASAIFLLAIYTVNILAFFVLFWRLCATNDAKGKFFLETAAERSKRDFCFLTMSFFTAVSLRTLELFLLVYSTRFVGLLSSWRTDSMWAPSCFVLAVNLIFAGLSFTLVRFHEPTKFTYDQQHDSWPHCQLFVVLCALFTLMNMHYYLDENLHTFSSLVQVGAVVPQFVTLRRCRPTSNNGVQSFVTLMFLYNVMALPFDGDNWLLRTIPYVWFFYQFNKESNDASDVNDGVQGQATSYDRKLWIASVRSEIICVYGDMSRCFLDLWRSMLQNEVVQNRLAAVRGEAEITYGNVEHELGSPAAVVHANDSQSEPSEGAVTCSHTRDDSDVVHLNKHDVETGNCVRVGTVSDANGEEESESLPLLYHHDSRQN
jgi:ER lumen protein retaining receptor